MGKAIRERKIKCADCSVRMRLQGRARLKYVCPKCNASLIAGQNGKPMGVPVTKETRQWRRRAHTVFDQLWRSGVVTRSSAQRWLAKQLGIPTNRCHFGYMEKAMLEKVVRLCDEAAEGERPGPTATDEDPVTSQQRRMANESMKLLRRTGANPTALRYWIAHHVKVDAYDDIGGFSSEQCEQLVRQCERVFFCLCQASACVRQRL